MSTPTARPRRAALGALLAAVLSLAGLTAAGLTAAQSATAAPATMRPAANLFQWTWNSIAQECTTQLGPAGYGYVQTSPPNEHVVLAGQWWTSYQPVSYKVASKLGTRAEYKAMIDTCRAAGVSVITDVVVNHMSGQTSAGTGWAGTPYSEERYPGPEGGYGPQDFHSCKTNISSYNDRWQVQNCRLVSLQDLDTGSDYVRSEIAAYLNDLISLGVRGFRVDASKHIAAGDLEAIRGKLTDQSVYIEHEVIAGGGEPIQPAEYFGSGDSNEFNYSRNLKSVFQSGNLSSLGGLKDQSWLLPTGKAAVFVDNHDTERNGETLSYKNGSDYRLANVFALSYPYGWPTVYSGYAFSNNDAGAPQQSNGKVNDAVCGQGTWTCAHRWNETAHMVGFRNAVGTAALTNVWSDGGRLAYGRGSLGYVAINRDGSALQRTFQTSLPAGRYCDVISGATTSGGCSGTTVTVASGGSATFTVPANGSVALHVGQLAGGTATPTPSPTGVSQISFGVNATTSWGQNIYVVGDRAELGSWNPAGAIALSSATYPVWRANVTLPAGTVVQYKYVRKESNGAVTWESGSNRTATVPASGVLTLTDTWRS
ncbi:glycosidase [Cellulomonas sp. Root485]|uniref:carbohydrate-binding module family 20 domain-containing protein n=1 Tax=Cellulomonas sp. Root485 TaxID=1736546 RepID=UPI0006FD2663|nr:carbohydrate-binding module family 20 domain-containing protein [Cellulomonas sp. Root485]KQY25509.1 glycosidase [Cellulomonas sp. Root485]